jgi:tetratricopeptide (TPR) repeat protein
METTLSTTLRASTRAFNPQMRDADMSIAEYIMLLRDTLYPSGKNELTTTATGRKVSNDLGEILTNMNSVVTRDEIDHAVKSYRQTVLFNPDDIEAHFQLGISCLLLKDRHSALKQYKILKELNPRIADELVQRWNIKSPW